MNFLVTGLEESNNSKNEAVEAKIEAMEAKMEAKIE
jgi:hypothetical protein